VLFSDPANKGADPACHAPDPRRGGDTHVIRVEKNHIGSELQMDRHQQMEGKLYWFHIFFDKKE
jgi:hypothetical protein